MSPWPRPTSIPSGTLMLHISLMLYGSVQTLQDGIWKLQDSWMLHGSKLTLHDSIQTLPDATGMLPDTQVLSRIWGNKYKLLNHTFPLPSSSAMEIRPRWPFGWSVVKFLKTSQGPDRTDNCTRICPAFLWKHSVMEQTPILLEDSSIG